jgi:lambda repressor-like predicted transcriptional regulator
MKNPTIETLTAALELHKDGVAIKAILAETGLNYSQAWYFIRTEILREQNLLVADAGPADIKALRDEGLSWGEIAVRCQLAESKIRRMFTESTDLKSQGLRIGKGGRFYYGPDRGRPLYTDGLQKTGTEIPKGAHYEAAVTAADSQKLIHWDMAELKAKAVELGITVPAKTTKASLASKIRKAQKVEVTGIA